MEKNGREVKGEGESKAHDHAAPSGDTNRYPKKRRKVNHGTPSPLTDRLRQLDMEKERHMANFGLRVPTACVYCRRSVCPGRLHVRAG